MERTVVALGYLRLHVTDLPAWRRLATGVLGLCEGTSDDPGTLRLRMDERIFRLELVAGTGHEVLGVGWEVPDEDALQRVAAVLQASGIAHEAADAARCDARGVSGLLTATDPAGIPVEFFWGARHDPARFVSPRAAAFLTGPHGMGHVVFRIPPERHTAQMRFYQALGFRLSDRFRAGGVEARFLRCNARHHSLAMAPIAGAAALVHFMIEAIDLDMVGLALDGALDQGVVVKRGLGRHTNDRMISFYAQTPSGFDVEYGWGGRLVDDATWSVAEVAGGTLWGHRPPAQSGSSQAAR
ncbi:MAG TPA: VOC family protein [Burkholderiaceae bacterium]|nr:VOC family protein [Burkholderiaceae bacterium]